MRKAALEKLGLRPEGLPRWAAAAVRVRLRRPGEPPRLPKVKVICASGVSSDVAASLKAAARGIASVSPPEHDVRVVALPCFTVDAAGGAGERLPAHGFFQVPWGDCPSIVASVGLVVSTGFYEEAYVSRSKVIAGVLQTLGHEWAHYEQWRDGRLVTERGVEVRGRSLVAAALAAEGRRRGRPT